VFLLPAIGLGPLSLSFVVTWLPALWGTIVLWTWIFNNAKGSILIAILMHSAYDAAGAYVFGTIIAVNALSAAAGQRVAIVEALVFVALSARYSP
jgi:hypothetical protein